MSQFSLEIIAHRGSSYLAPENTLAAAKLAWSEGADAVEGDFRLTADGEIICLHDATLGRTGGIDLAVAACTMTELAKIDVGNWKDTKFHGETAPTLSRLLATVPEGKRFLVEIKCGAEVIPVLQRVAGESGLDPDQIVPICMDFEVCHAIKEALPEHPVYWVVQFRQDRDNNWRPTPEEIFRRVEDFQLDGLDVMASGPIDDKLVEEAKARNLDLCAWTVDDPILAKRLVELGIPGITTNRPGWLRQELQRSER